MLRLCRRYANGDALGVISTKKLVFLIYDGLSVVSRWFGGKRGAGSGERGEVSATPQEAIIPLVLLCGATLVKYQI